MSEPILRLLLVDDEDSVREPLARHLSAEPYKYVVKDVANANEAVRILEETNGRFDVALIDEVLEEGPNGLDLLQQIKARYPQIACILFTGWGMRSGLDALRAGAYRYFAKPFNLEELALTIRFAGDQQLLQRERAYLFTLVQVSRELTRTTNLEDQLVLVWNYVREQLATPTFFIALYDAETDSLQFHQSYDEGEPDPLSDRNLGADPSGWGVAGYVVRTGREQVWFNREQAMQEWQALGIMPHVTGKGPSETGICLPLQVGEKILGALSVQSYQPQAFDQAFLNAVRTLGGHIASVIENSRLFQEIIQRTGEVETTRDHLDRLVASSFDGIVTIDNSGIVTSFNAMAEQILGYVAKQVIGKSVRDLYYDLEEPRRIGKLLKQSADGKLTEYETDVKSNRGDRIPIRLSAIWLFDSQGNRIGSAGYFRDLRHIQETEMHRQRLLEANNAVAEAVSLEQGLQSLSKIMVESCIATFCSILLLAPDDKSLIVRAAYPFPRSERLVWDPGIDKLCTPFREPGATKMVISDEPIVLRKGRKRAEKVLKHLAEETKLSGLLHSILIVPLQVKKRCLGICILGEMRAWDRSPITARKIELAQSLANQAATFIEKMRSHELTRQRAELLEALQNLSLNISSSLNLDEILKRTCQAAVELFGVDHSGLVLFNSDHVKGKVVAEYPTATHTLETEIPLRNVPLEEKLIETREPISVFDIEDEEDLGPVREIMYGKFDIHSTVFVPVISKGKLLGSFSLDAINHKRHFTQEEIELCKIFATHVASAIENANLHQETEQRNQLLEALEKASRHIRAEKEPVKLLQEVVRLAAELMGCTAGGLFIDHSHLGVLELVAAYGLPVNLPRFQISHGEGLIGSVAKTGEPKTIHAYSNWPDREAAFEQFEFSALAGIPLKRAGEVVAVLFVADNTGMRHFDKGNLEILERFAAHALIALHTSQLMDKEQRGLSQLAILHRISDYLQEAKEQDKILHVVLTGVTAGYGLGFNRAALLLLDERRKNLVGSIGIGHLDEAEARADWEKYYQHGFDDFGRYLEALEQGTLATTPVDERIRALHLARGSELPDIFSRTIQEQQWKLVEQDDLDALPDDFVAAFEPALPLVVIPIIARERVLGILVADNKFTRAPVTSEDVDLLLTFANTAALAIDNVQLYQEAAAARAKIRTLFEASNALVLSQASKQLLEDVIDQTQRAAGASWVSIVLVDEIGQARNLFTTGTDKVDISTVVRPEGITMQVVRSGEAEVIEDTQMHRQPVNSRMFRNKVAAALCLPFSVQGKRIGVIWIHCDKPRHFTKYEVEAIQLFVNQAAITYDGARRMEELDHMRKAAEAMASVLVPAQVLQQIVESASDVLQADSLAIWSYDNIRNQFIPEEFVAYGISKNELDRFRKSEPKEGGTARTVMEQGWVGVTDIADPKYTFMGPSTKELLKSISAKSFQGVALKVSDEDLGVLYANYNRPRYITDEDRRILETFAYHAALALKKARLLEQVSKARDAAKVVAQVSVLEDLRKTLASIVRGTQEVLGCDAVTLYTYDQDRNEFGFPPAMVGVEKKTGVLKLGHVSDQSVVRNVLALEKAHEAEDTLSDPLMRGPFVFRERIKSSVGIPLRVGDRKVGVMFINYRSRHRFTADESTNIELFANQAAVAIRNAQLFEERERVRKRQEMVASISQKASANLELVELLDTLYQELEQVLGAQILPSVALWNEQDRCLRLVESRIHDYKSWVIELEKESGCISLGEGVTGWVAEHKEPLYIPDIEQEPRYKRFVETTKAELAVPILYGQDKELIGVLDIESPETNAFSEEEVSLVQTLANQLAVAIRNAQLYEKTRKQAETLDGLYRAGKAITSTLSIDNVLTRIAEQGLHVVGANPHPGCFSHVALCEGDKLRFIACWPLEIIDDLRKNVGEIDLQKDERKGIAGHAVLTGQSQKVDEVAGNPEYIPLRENIDIHAQLSIPLKIGERVIGVLSIEHPKPAAFGLEDMQNIESLAAQATVWIENTRSFEELKKTKETLAARTALAWTGKVGTTWWHAIEKHAITIREQIKLLRDDLTVVPTDNMLSKRLEMIERLVEKILSKPLTAPLGVEEEVVSLPVNDFVKERVHQLWDDEPYKTVALELQLELEDSASVRASPVWLRQVLDILVENAVNAMEGMYERNIAISTRRTGRQAEITVYDSGHGIPPEVKERLFNTQIPKSKDTKGLGIGLLFAQMIVQTYGGEIQIKETGKTGTTMIVKMFLEN